MAGSNSIAARFAGLMSPASNLGVKGPSSASANPFAATPIGPSSPPSGSYNATFPNIAGGSMPALGGGFNSVGSALTNVIA